MDFPKMIKIRQKINDECVKDIKKYFKKKIAYSSLVSTIKNGDSVAITAGSRGITDIVPIITILVEELKKLNAKPFIIPAMGSHGGATAEGQSLVLSEYGITQKTIGAPIYSSMEVVKLGETKSGIPVYIDKIAKNANHIIVVNRIKSHTEFFGKIESGLIKMLVVGLGKHKGALTMHSYAVKFGYEKTLTDIEKVILENAPISLGIGIIENGYRKTYSIECIEPDDFIDKEKLLLGIAKKITPKLPFEKIDVLIVDEAGKDISGTGMDTKVIGRIRNIYEKELTKPRITRIVLRGLTKKTNGNAIGVGLADFITKSLADEIDMKATFVNTVTAVTPEKGRLPLICDSDKEAIENAFATAGPIGSKKIRMVRIKNTSELSEMYISEGLLDEVNKQPNIEIISKGAKLEFSEEGQIIG